MIKPLLALAGATLILTLTTSPVRAGPDADLPPLGSVSLRADASSEVDNDVMRAVLFAEDEDADPTRLADRINRVTASALAIAKAQSGVKARTGGYQTHPVYDKTRIVRWRARSDLILESMEFRTLSALLGQLQSTLKLGGVDFTVSPELRRRTQDELVGTAIAEFQRRAGLVARSFGASGYRMRNAVVETGEGGVPPIPRVMAAMRAAPAMEAVQAPVVEAGTSRITVSVDGIILLEGL
jgi:predicted secreted protein